MDRRVSTRLGIGAIATLGSIGISLSMVTLNGLWSPGSGDLLVSPATASGMNLALLAGSTAILGLEFAHVRRLRRRHDPVIQVRAPFKP